jgi:hypothetical protein
MEKFVEIDAATVSGKVGWEMEACFELKRAATNSKGQMLLTFNNGKFDGPGYEAKGTYAVSIILDATGDFSNHEFLTKEEADELFERHL